MKSSLETKGIIWTSLSWSLIGRCAKLPTANKMILALPFEKILHRWKMPVAHWPAKDITATKQKSLCFRGHSCTSSPYDRSHYICVWCLLLWFTVHGLIGQRDNQGVTCCRRWGGKIVGGWSSSEVRLLEFAIFLNITEKLEWRAREKLCRSWRFMIDSSLLSVPFSRSRSLGETWVN